MRVISGTAGGRRLVTGKGMDIRPTSDKTRGAIFNILQGRIDGRRVLDLFAGSGAMGIEALSRGASFATFVDSANSSLDFARKNLESTGFADMADVYRLDIPKGLVKLKERGRTFELIFADPPYDKGLAEAALVEVAALDLAAPGAIIVVEHSVRESMPDEAGGLTKTDSRRWSSTAASFYERRL